MEHPTPHTRAVARGLYQGRCCVVSLCSVSPMVIHTTVFGRASMFFFGALMQFGAWPFVVGGVNRLVNFVDDRDLCLLYCVKYDSYLITGFVVLSAHFQKLPLLVLFFGRSFSIR